MYKPRGEKQTGTCTYCGKLLKVGEDGHCVKTKRSTFVYWHEPCRQKYYKEYGGKKDA